MNKKLIPALSTCAVLLAILVVVLLVLKPDGKQPNVRDPQGTESQISANNPSTPDAWGEPVSTEPSLESQTTEPESTEVTIPTAPTEIPEDPTAPPVATIPPENVDMGTEKDEEASGSLENENTSNAPTQGKDPEQTTPPTENNTPDGDVLGPDFDITTLTYEEFMAMTGEQQRAVIDLFGSPDDFMTWFKAVEAIYKAEHPDIEIGGDGNVDVGG